MALIGKSVQVVAGSGRVLIVDPHTGEVVADHAVVAPGEASVADEHYGGARPKPRRAIRPRTPAEKAFCGLGLSAEAFLAGAAASGHTRLGPELSELNTLAAAHGHLVFLAALEQAAAHRARCCAHLRTLSTVPRGHRPGKPPPTGRGHRRLSPQGFWVGSPAEVSAGHRRNARRPRMTHRGRPRHGQPPPPRCGGPRSTPGPSRRRPARSCRSGSSGPSSGPTRSARRTACRPCAAPAPARSAAATTATGPATTAPEPGAPVGRQRSESASPR